MKRISILFLLVVTLVNGQTVTDVDASIAQGDFKTALDNMIEVNRLLALKKYPKELGKHERKFSAYPTDMSALVMRSRALFERGFYSFLVDKDSDVMTPWVDGLKLISQSGDPQAAAETRRIVSALFLYGVIHSPLGVETFNRSLQATAEQLDRLPLPNRTEVFVQQLTTEFEIQATQQILASIFGNESGLVETDLWSHLLAQRTLTELLIRPTSVAFRTKSYESICDTLFFSSSNRMRFHEILLKQSIASLALADPDKYARGVARLALLRALFFEDAIPKVNIDGLIQDSARFRWNAFSAEIIDIMRQLDRHAINAIRSRLIDSVEPVLSKVTLSPLDGVFLAKTLIENNRSQMGYDYCQKLLSTTEDAPMKSRVDALAAIALAQMGRFPECLRRSDGINELNSLPADDYVTLRYQRGIAYAQLGESDKSIKENRELLKVAPYHKLGPSAQLSIALQYVNLGEKTNARKALNDYLSRYPDAEASDFARKFLASL
jgi:tetratricopeptide (TPR) repeat protein